MKYPAITCEKFRPGRAGSLFCTTGIPLCRDEILSCYEMKKLFNVCLQEKIERKCIEI